MPRGMWALSDLHGQCVEDDETGCMVWQGCVQLRPAAMGATSVEPRVRLAQSGITTTLPRAAWILSGKPIPPGRWMAWRTCGNHLCGNPGHMLAGTRADWGQWVRASQTWVGSRARVVAGRLSSRSRTKLSLADAKLIRESSLTQKELARRFGVSQSTISKIRLYERLVESIPQSSIFSPGIASNMPKMTERA